MIGSKSSVLLLLSLLLIVLVNAASRDFYSILDVPRDAPKSQIKRHFKKLSRTFHPDKNPGNEEAAQKFMEIANAYEVLSDDDLRQVYDRYGEDGVKQKQNGGGQQQNPFGDFFSQFFGGNHGHQGRNKGPNTSLDLEVTLEELYNGADIELDISKQVICDHCFGSGAHTSESIRTCHTCQGQGTIVKRVQLAPGFVQQFQQHCDVCGGKGKVIKEHCHVCKGNKVKRGNEQYTVNIEKGMTSGQQVIFEEEGDELPGRDHGDIVFTIHTRLHPVFERNGNNLYTKQTISLIEALTGFKKTITHLDQQAVPLERTGVTPFGFVETIKGAGMPLIDNPNSFGDLYVEYIVNFPANVDLGFVNELEQALKDTTPQTKDEL